MGKRAQARKELDAILRGGARDVDSDPMPELMDLDAAQAAIREGHRQRSQKS